MTTPPQPEPTLTSQILAAAKARNHGCSIPDHKLESIAYDLTRALHYASVVEREPHTISSVITSAVLVGRYLERPLTTLGGHYGCIEYDRASTLIQAADRVCHWFLGRGEEAARMEERRAKNRRTRQARKLVREGGN